MLLPAAVLTNDEAPRSTQKIMRIAPIDCESLLFSSEQRARIAKKSEICRGPLCSPTTPRGQASDTAELHS